MSSSSSVVEKSGRTSSTRTRIQIHVPRVMNAIKQDTQDWPSWSASSLPPLLPHVVESLDKDCLEYSINEECTSLKLVPSGRHLVAGFSDGTLRLFDLSGRFNKTLEDSSNQKVLFDTDSSSSEDELVFKNNKMVLSKNHQQYGAVAAQIHARGVHTSLRMKVDCSQDGLYCFAGVSRGSSEFVAVHLAKLDSAAQQGNNNNMLDLVQVHRHADAKLKGFGACTRLRNGSCSKNPKYLLFTGLGIKNLHIWSFEPPTNNSKEPIWQCLYDTQTNGNSINLLKFRHDPHGLLQGISKSDDQKLRIWDLSYEQHEGKVTNPFYNKQSVISNLVQPASHRPKRPPFVDVANTESALGIAGAFGVCGGGGMYNQMSVVPLDVENVTWPYNHTDLALPNSVTPNIRSRRQQRGELKSIVSVAGMNMDAGHVLLELSNGSVVQYSQNHLDSVGLPRLQTLEPSLFMTRSEKLAVGHQDNSSNSRQLCLTRVGSQGMVVAAVSSYNQNTGRGSIVLRHLREGQESPKGFWGFHGASLVSEKSGAARLYPTPRKESRSDINPRPVGTLSIVTPKVARKVPPKTAPRGQSPDSAVESPNAILHSTATPKVAMQQAGIAISPEQPSPCPVVPDKKDGAIVKFLRPATKAQEEMGDKATRKEHPTKKKAQLALSSKSIPSIVIVKDKSFAKRKEPMDNAKKVSKGLPKSKKPAKRKEAPESVESAKKKTSLQGRTPKVAKTKRTRSTSPKKPTKTPHADGGAIREVAGALWDIRKGPPRKFLSPAGKQQSSNARLGFLSPKLLYKKPPQPLVYCLPKTTVAQRLGLANTSGCSIVSEAAKEQAATQRLAVQHRAEHEMLRKRVLASTDRAIQLVVSSSSLYEAQPMLEEDIAGYEEMMHDMIGRQQMEASALAAQQSVNSQQAPVLQVSFPFPEVFAQARDSFQSFCSVGSK